MKRKKLFIPLFGTLCLAILAWSFKAADKSTSSGSSFIIMRTKTSIIHNNRPVSIKIIDENGSVQVVDFRKTKGNEDEEYLSTVQQELNKIKSRGYKLVCTTPSSTDAINVDYIFEKE